jgi:predicted PurR-regulated permease PerM
MDKIIAFVGLVFALWLGRPLLIPIITAVFLWYLTNAIAVYYKKVFRFEWLSRVLAGSSLLGVLYLFITQIQPMFAELHSKMPEITMGAERILSGLSDLIGVRMSFSDMPNMQSILTNIGSSIASISAGFGMILVYMLFIFLEQNTFSKKIKALFPSSRQLSKVKFILGSIDSHMKKYLFIKTGISLITAVSTYLFLTMVNVDFAIVWAFLTFILNYIPTFGSIAAVALPTVYVLAISPDLRDAITVGSVLTVFQIVFGNILDPKLTGKTLNLSTLAILINLVFWGIVWGPIGMFFSVPLLVAAFVVCSQFDKTRWIAILLSADGEIPEKKEE